MSSSLLQEIVVDILHKLPIRSLLQCMCVCKPWHSLINNPSFISTHLTHTIFSTKNSLFLLRVFCDQEEHLSLHFDDKDLTDYMNLDLPYRSNRYYYLIGSCNGLVCFADRFVGCRSTFMLWNPCIRKCLRLPRPNVTFQTHGAYRGFVGFGFDPSTNDYKVLRIAEFANEKKHLVEIYSLILGSWKALPAVTVRYEILEYCSQAFVNGVFHFIASQETQFILGFEVCNEVYTKIKLPKCLAEVMSVLVYKESTISILTRGSLQCHLWVMNNYGDTSSWHKLLSIPLNGGKVPTSLVFRNNGRINFSVL